MSCKNDEVPIREGHNFWVLARTDRDAPTAEQVVDTAGAFLARELGSASPLQLRNFTEHLSTSADGSTGRFIIGAARPITIRATHPDGLTSAELLLPSNGKMLASRTECDVLRTVQAQKPWIVTAEFDWRAPSTAVDWPRRKVVAGAFPIRADTELDWLLLGAAHTGAPIEPDTSWWGEVSDAFLNDFKSAAKRAREVAEEEAHRLLVPAVVGVAAVGIYYLWRSRRRRSLA